MSVQFYYYCCASHSKHRRRESARRAYHRHCDGHDGAAVIEATVLLVDAGGAIVDAIKSEGEGRYIIENVTAGSYVVRTTKTTFADPQQAVTVAGRDDGRRAT